MAGRRLTPSELRTHIAGGVLHSLYLIHGDDETEKAELAAAFPSAVEEDVRAFNVERVYAGEASTTVAGILDSARTLPWLSRHRIILVLQAERLLMPARPSEATERDLELLEEYAKAPQPHAALVLVASSLDRRRRIVNLLLKQATVIDCSGPGAGGDARTWIRARVAEAGARIDAGAARLLADRAGHDIGRLRADLDRVLMYVAGERTITSVDVEEVARDTTLKDQWAIARAVESGSASDALRELALLLASGVAPLQVLGQLGWVVRADTPRGRYPDARIPAAVDALFRTDVDLKLSAGDPRVLLERLVVELCSVTRPAGGKTPAASR